MTKKDDKETTLPGRAREFVAKTPRLSANYKQIEEHEAAQLLERFNEEFPEIANYVARFNESLSEIGTKMNADVKGALGRECARAVCSNKDARWFNKSTRKFYCGKCAGRINLHNPGLCVMAAGLTDAQLEALKI